MARDVSDATPIESRDQLVEALASGAKPKSAWRVGTEHEKFGFYQADCSPVPYDGPRGIRRAARRRWRGSSAGSRSSTRDNIIGL
jgi:glutamate--cysteine ligase